MNRALLDHAPVCGETRGQMSGYESPYDPLFLLSLHDFSPPTMYQVTFSEQSMLELNKLNKLDQLDAIEPISSLKPADLEHPREPLGRFTRAGQSLYRLRSGDHRFYFEIRGQDTIHVLYILHSNSLEDFLLRNKLPVTETQLVEQHSKFWKYLESLTKK
jgi:mRNA interferase RelE/StbE